MNLSNLQLDTILNNISDAVLAVDTAGRITIFNTIAYRIVGCTGEVAGQFISDVVPNTRLPVILQTGKEELNQLQYMGETTVMTNRFPIFDENKQVVGAAAVFKDVSEVKSLKEQIGGLQEVRTLLSAIFEATQDAISVVDENGLGILINPAYTKITGLTEEDVINKSATVDIAEGESVHLKVLQNRKPIRAMPMKVGPKRKEVLVYGSPIVVGGKLRGSVGVIHDISELRKLSEELERVKCLIRHLESKYTFSDIVSKSEVMRTTLEKAMNAACTPVTVLIRGESGTGKELFAHAIHHASDRAKESFIRVNCAALNDNILDSELFGYVEGAFTGAKKGGKLGLFEEANGGTIFLDEIGDISLALQAKLLRVLQEKEIVRVGDTRTISVNVRIIAATNVNLEEKIKSGMFRPDLYYRLNVFPIIIPPLRQHIEDIKLLSEHLIRKFNQEFGRNVLGVGSAAMAVLSGYHWPGNVRELENIIGRAIINMRSGETIIEVHHIPQLSSKADYSLFPVHDEYNQDQVRSFEDAYNEWEKNLIIKTLHTADNNKIKAARLMQISVRSLYYKMKKHNL